MSVTLADLRALLETALTHTENPAILRLPEKERTVEGVAREYLPALIRRVKWIGHVPPYEAALHESWTWTSPRCLTHPLDLTDPGTAHAFLVALALGMGLDPGVGGIGVSWSSEDRHHPNVWRGNVMVVAEHVTKIWALEARRKVWFATGPSFFRHEQIGLVWIDALSVANEPDPIRALELAVRHVLEGR